MTRHRPDNPKAFLAASGQLLAVLRHCPGFVRGLVGTSADDAAVIAVVLEFDDVGSYRRALGQFEVRPLAALTLATAEGGESAFEPAVVADASGIASHEPDRSPDASRSGPLRGR